VTAGRAFRTSLPTVESNVIGFIENGKKFGQLDLHEKKALAGACCCQGDGDHQRW
jgi:hypothetical protein